MTDWDDWDDDDQDDEISPWSFYPSFWRELGAPFPQDSVLARIWLATRDTIFVTVPGE